MDGPLGGVLQRAIGVVGAVRRVALGVEVGPRPLSPVGWCQLGALLVVDGG